MNNVRLKKKALCMSAFFFLITLMTNNTMTMESEFKQSELKHRLLSNHFESEDIHITLEQSFTGECSICYEEDEILVIPCGNGASHDKVCTRCLDGCMGKCPYCRGELATDKKRSLAEVVFHKLESTYDTYQDCRCVSTGCGWLSLYASIIMHSLLY